MSLKTFLKKSRTLLAGDLREIEANRLAARNARVLEKYKGQEIYGILRLYTDEGGLFNFVLKELAGVSYCVQHDLIPVVDMQTKENIFFNAAERKEKNAWECFFEQPAGISFSEVKEKKNAVILENPRMPGGTMTTLQQMEQQTRYWRTVAKKYLRFSQPVKDEIARYEERFSSRKKWLGVLARGTDYLSRGVGHAVQPDRETLMDKIREVKEAYHCDGIFLATEDEEILDAFRKEYGEELFYLDQKRYRGKQDEKLGQMADYRQNAIEMNITYLAATAFLSRCSCLIAANTGGATGAYLMSEGYEYSFCWFLGTMGSTDPETLDISKLEGKRNW